MEKTLTMIMAGGRGERLYPLTKENAKPAVTFGGIYKIIDFTLSNCLNSGIRRIYLLTQYSNATLDKHMHLAWGIFNRELDEFIDNIPPQKVNVDWWYRGTADSIYQNINILERERPQHVLILSGDHIYKMDYRKMLDFHQAKQCDLTVACVEINKEKAHQMGVFEVDDAFRIIGFQEKPARPKSVPWDRSKSLVSMGVYVFKTERLVREIIDDAKRESDHDFGRNIIPRMIKKRSVFVYNFIDEKKGGVEYWRDVGSLDSYHEANMELLKENPVFDLYDTTWPIRTYQEQAPPAKVVLSGDGEGLSRGVTINSLISNGCLIIGGKISRSILSPFVQIHSHCRVENSILMKGVTVGHHARIRKAIIDEGVTIPPHYTIGYNLEEDRKKFTVSESGIVVVPQGFIVD
jgi:glucose-1-phosphate adenylyltransferase